MLFSMWAVAVLVAQLAVMPQVMAEGDSMDVVSDSGGGGDGMDALDYGEGTRAGGGEYNKQPGYGMPIPQPGNGDQATTAPPNKNNKGGGKNKKDSEQQTMVQMTIKAILQLGMIVGVAILCGSLFMGLVWMEMLMDHLAEKYRKFFDKPEPIPDIERLHPAELVGTFARYK